MGGEDVSVGTWSPPQPVDAITVAMQLHRTDNAEEAERWRTELSAGPSRSASRTLHKFHFKTNGEPHWPTRLAAVRMLATLRPEEFSL
jgi:hypothetical protein